MLKIAASAVMDDRNGIPGLGNVLKWQDATYLVVKTEVPIAYFGYGIEEAITLWLIPYDERNPLLLGWDKWMVGPVPANSEDVLEVLMSDEKYFTRKR